MKCPSQNELASSSKQTHSYVTPSNVGQQSKKRKTQLNLQIHSLIKEQLAKLNEEMLAV